MSAERQPEPVAGTENGRPARADDIERQRRVISGHAGALPGVYEPGYLDQLRQEWPE
jgi:hypothetical protein